MASLKDVKVIGWTSTYPHISRAYGRLYIIANVSRPSRGCVRFSRYMACNTSKSTCAKKRKYTYCFDCCISRFCAMLPDQQKAEDDTAHACYYGTLTCNLCCGRMRRWRRNIWDCQKRYICIEQNGGLSIPSQRRTKLTMLRRNSHKERIPTSLVPISQQIVSKGESW